MFLAHFNISRAFALTKALISVLRSSGATVVYFNGKDAGGTPLAGHDNHIHVSWITESRFGMHGADLIRPPSARSKYVLQSGCRLEQLELATAARLQNALATLSIVAWRLWWLTYLARTEPEAPCAVALERDDWQALYARV